MMDTIDVYAGSFFLASGLPVALERLSSILLSTMPI